MERREAERRGGEREVASRRSVTLTGPLGRRPQCRRDGRLRTTAPAGRAASQLTHDSARGAVLDSYVWRPLRLPARTLIQGCPVALTVTLTVTLTAPQYL